MQTIARVDVEDWVHAQYVRSSISVFSITTNAHLPQDQFKARVKLDHFVRCYLVYFGKYFDI